MKKLLFILTITILCPHASILYAQDLDEILQEHAKVMGYDKLKDVKTITIVGENYFGDRTMPFKTIFKFPSKYYNERDFMGRKMLQIIDGDKAWSLNPRNGMGDITGSRLEMLKKNAVFGGLLYNWEEKGLKISLDGTEDYEGTEVLKLLVENPEGEVSEIYLDADSYITLKQTSIRVFEENEIRATKAFSNYQMIDGIAVAFNSVTTSDGQTSGGGGGRRMGGGTMVIKTIVFNAEVNDVIFVKPESVK